MDTEDLFESVWEDHHYKIQKRMAKTEKLFEFVLESERKRMDLIGNIMEKDKKTAYLKKLLESNQKKHVEDKQNDFSDKLKKVKETSRDHFRKLRKSEADLKQRFELLEEKIGAREESRKRMVIQKEREAAEKIRKIKETKEILWTGLYDQIMAQQYETQMRIDNLHGRSVSESRISAAAFGGSASVNNRMREKENAQKLREEIFNKAKQRREESTQKKEAIFISGMIKKA